MVVVDSAVVYCIEVVVLVVVYPVAVDLQEHVMLCQYSTL